jgi:hypothetical protein
MKTLLVVILLLSGCATPTDSRDPAFIRRAPVKSLPLP